jgi:hypothetical protein
LSLSIVAVISVDGHADHASAYPTSNLHSKLGNTELKVKAKTVPLASN